MQFTLVSHYGKKPAPLGLLLKTLQQVIQESLHNDFIPRNISQIHFTIIGLEGLKIDSTIANLYTKREICFAKMFSYLDAIKPFTLRIGGFIEEGKYTLKSRNLTLFQRSFSINDDGNVVIIGWPSVDIFSDGNTVNNIRRDFSQFNILHKYFFIHGDDAVDNALRCHWERQKYTT
jgi:hypothetical protein